MQDLNANSPRKPPQKPAAITVFGVLNILFGVIGGFGLMASAAILITMDPSNPMTAVLEASEFYRAWLWGSSMLGILVTGALIAAGVGLLTAKPWGRLVSIGYAIYTIVMGVIGMVINMVFVVGPLIEAAEHTGGPAQAGALGGAVGGSFGGCIGLIYPVLLLIFMMRSNVVEYLKSSS